MRAAVGVRSSPHRIDPGDEGVASYRWRLNLLDQVAVEAALQTADEVVVVGIGGDRAHDAIRTALRMGADEGVHVAYDPIAEQISEKYAVVLARAAGRERADALFVGASAPTMGVEVAGLAAETLRWPAVSQITAIGADAVAVDTDEGVESNADESVVIQRKLATGRQEVVACELPAVFGIDGSFANPRRASLDVAIAAQRAEIREIDLESVAPSQSRFSMSVGRATVESVRANERWGRGRPARSGSVEERIRQMLGRDVGERETGGELIEGQSPEETAQRVVAYLRANELL